jgi:hypothetical protein
MTEIQTRKINIFKNNFQQSTEYYSFEFFLQFDEIMDEFESIIDTIVTV